MLAEMNNNSEQHSYSRVYSLLVNGEDDLVGQIASLTMSDDQTKQIVKIRKFNREFIKNMQVPNHHHVECKQSYSYK